MSKKTTNKHVLIQTTSEAKTTAKVFSAESGENMPVASAKLIQAGYAALSSKNTPRRK